MQREPVLIEGCTVNEMLSLLEEQEALVFSGRPVVFRVGSARILGQFSLPSSGPLVLELAQIDGGGEGVLPTLAALAQRYARKRGVREVEWLVYATNCAEPNLKLRRVLVRRGFTVREVAGKGECYYKLAEVASS
jgi:hypothetical protein